MPIIQLSKAFHNFCRYLRNVGILPQHYTRHNPEDWDMNISTIKASNVTTVIA